MNPERDQGLIEDLTARGAPAEKVRLALTRLRQIKNPESIRTVMGEPDSEREWDPDLDEMSISLGGSPGRFERQYSYTSDYYPLLVFITVREDGRIDFIYAVATGNKRDE